MLLNALDRIWSGAEIVVVGEVALGPHFLRPRENFPWDIDLLHAPSADVLSATHPRCKALAATDGAALSVAAQCRAGDRNSMTCANG